MSGTQALVDWMSDAEYEWRKRLQPVNLVIESDFVALDIRQLQSRYGSRTQQLVGQGFARKEMIKKYPAVTLMILVGHASLAYDHGAYWESFWQELGLSRDYDFENALRSNIDAMLGKFSLARIPDVQKDKSRKYVMLLAMHAGIPVHCLADLLGMLSEHIVNGRMPSGAAVIEWLHEPGKEHRAASLDVPVRNFLMHGAEFAIDILDRVIEFLEAVTTDPTLLDLELDSSTTGLPTVLVDELVSLLQEKPVKVTGRSATVGVKSRPSIAYNFRDDEVVVRLPYPKIGAEEPWRVSFDGEVRDVYCSRSWGGSVAATQVPIPGPVRELVMTHGGSGESTVLALVAKADPLLTFGEKGDWIPHHDGLVDVAWVVYPQSHTLIDAVTGTPVKERDDGSPAGWPGWRSAFIELDDVGALQLEHFGHRVGTPRPVRKEVRPRFELSEPVAGIHTSEGRSVYAERPWVMLPASLEEQGPRWQVRVRRVGDTDWAVVEEWRAEDEETCVDPFDDAPESQLGLFEVEVTGPLGSNARCVVFLAEGLSVDYDVNLRVPQGNGLSPCTAFVDVDGLELGSISPIHFSESDFERTFEVADDRGAVACLMIRPPHVAMRTGQIGKPAPWRTTVDVCTTDIVAQDRFIAVRAAGAEQVWFSYVAPSGEFVQVETKPKRRQDDVYEVALQKFADSVGSQPSGRFVATLQCHGARHEVPVLAVRPQELATAVELRGDALYFVDVADVADLAAYVWCSSAPWRSSTVVHLKGNVAQLPSDLLEAGELRCQLFVDDPWVLLDPPSKPADDAFAVQQSGWYSHGTGAQTKLSQYLAGRGPVPLGAGTVPEVWAAIAWLNNDRDDVRVSQLAKLLADNPREALNCLGNSTIPLQDKMAMLVRTELVNRSFATDDTANVLHSDPWFGCMVEISDLPSLYARRREVRWERAETLGYLRNKGGDLLMELLQSGKADGLHEGCYDKNVFAMSTMPSEQVDAILREITLVPGPLLHADTRFSAAFQAFCQRDEWSSRGWSQSFAAQTSFVLGPIKRASLLAYNAIKIRSDRLAGIDVAENPWMLMSLQSLTLAVLARLEAHGRVSGQYLNSGMLMSWTKLAQLCPNLVATDLLLAEALVIHDLRGNLVGEY
jgi:hypothetical protein